MILVAAIAASLALCVAIAGYAGGPALPPQPKDQLEASPSLQRLVGWGYAIAVARLAFFHSTAFLLCLSLAFLVIRLRSPRPRLRQTPRLRGVGIATGSRCGTWRDRECAGSREHAGRRWNCRCAEDTGHYVPAGNRQAHTDGQWADPARKTAGAHAVNCLLVTHCARKHRAQWAQNFILEIFLILERISDYGANHLPILDRCVNEIWKRAHIVYMEYIRRT
jgi:hypothetical protein